MIGALLVLATIVGGAVAIELGVVVANHVTLRLAQRRLRKRVAMFNLAGMGPKPGREQRKD